MIDHEIPEGSARNGNRMEVGFLHGHFTDILGTEEDNEAGPYQCLCDSGTELGRDFVSAWEALREAAGQPTDPKNVLCDPPHRAGLSLKTGEEIFGIFSVTVFG